MLFRFDLRNSLASGCSRQLLFLFIRGVGFAVVNGCIGFTREVVRFVVYNIDCHCSVMSTRGVVPIIVPSIAII